MQRSPTLYQEFKQARRQNKAGQNDRSASAQLFQIVKRLIEMLRLFEELLQCPSRLRHCACESVVSGFEPMRYADRWQHGAAGLVEDVGRNRFDGACQAKSRHGSMSAVNRVPIDLMQ